MTAIDLTPEISAKAASVVAFGEQTLTVAATDLVDVLTYLRDDPACQFVVLIDICGVDYPEREKRFDVVYHLLSPRLNKRIRVKTETDETTPVASVNGIFPAANWYEREAYDMYGIRFSGHPDLRRILMWEGYPYFPLRKDFPLAGRSSEVPEVAFTRPAPLEGGPFVTVPGGPDTLAREPRARPPED